jgi:hypothetical protein
MRQWYVWLVFMVISLSVRAGAPDTLSLNSSFSSMRYHTFIAASLSQTGYSTIAAGMAARGKLGISAGVKMVVNQAYTISDAPAGIVTGVYFFPNGTGDRFTAFMNIDYQNTFNNDGSALSAFFRPGNTVHEYTAGYGFDYHMGKRFTLSSQVNIGRYTQVLYNPILDSRKVYSGFDTMVRLGFNYTLVR